MPKLKFCRQLRNKINSEKIVRSDDNINPVRFDLGAFAVEKLVNGFVVWFVLKDYYQIILLHNKYLLLPVENLERFARTLGGYVLTKLSPFIKGVICDLKRVLFIGLNFSNMICTVVVN